MMACYIQKMCGKCLGRLGAQDDRRKRGEGRELFLRWCVNLNPFSLPFSSSFAQEARLGMCVTCEG